MQAITVRVHDAGLAGMSLTDLPYPHAAENDVIVRVHAAGFTLGELEWPTAWTDCALRADIGHSVAAALPISELTARQGGVGEA